MEFFQFLFDLMNTLVAFLNTILTVIEQLFSPIINLINRWNSLFGGLSG
jgi:hypothetical protein